MRLLRPCWLLAPCWLAFAPLSGAAQEEKKKEVNHEPGRLFRSDEPLALTLKAAYKTVFKDRDTLSTKTYPATLTYTDKEKGDVSLDVTLATRGHFRLRSATCSFAPLKVIFDKEKAKETLFKGEGSIKLITHCGNATRYEQNVLVEQAIYRVYNLLTDLSHRARLAHIRYEDTADSTKTVTRYGFFLEDDDDLAKRNGGKMLMQTGAALSDMDPGQIDLIGVFQYMIGNTDWSVYAIHNIRMVMVDGKDFIFPVAYDFDFSGLVNAPYAMPDERLPIKTVRDRLYRGPCRRIEEITPTLAMYNAKKEAIYDVFRKTPDLEPGRLKSVLDYLQGFFDDLKKPKDFEYRLDYPCKR